MDIRGMARSMYDPSRMNSGYRNEKRKLREAFTAEAAAQNALPGSVAERNDPNRYGSAAGRFNGNFQPDAPRLMHDPAYDIAAEQQQQMEEMMRREETQAASRLRRKKPGLGLDLGDDFDIGSLFGGLRREL